MKKIKILIPILMSMMLLTACNIKTEESQNDTNSSIEQESVASLQIELIAEDGDFEEWRDSETGVHYFIYKVGTVDGRGIGISPRYKADGTLYVD